MTNRKILIVEDEFLIRLTLAEALAEDGFEVIEAGSGDEALTLLQQQDGITLLLTDIQLPGGLDGVALARTAREKVPDMPVIYMTGRPDAFGASTRTPYDAFITKPYLPSEVCATARRMTGG